MFPRMRSLRLVLFPLLVALLGTSIAAEAGQRKRGGRHHGRKNKDKVTAPEAARFLNQTTFGPTSALLTQVQQQGFDAFLNSQFSVPQSLTGPRVDQAIAGLPTGNNPSNALFQEAWWYTIVNGPDQLRQRVAFALSEIFVVSANGSGMFQHPEAMATYWDLLARDAFGNFRQLLEDVTLNPAMGDYLDMVHNDKPDPRRNTEPNENYAREVMQLFTIGLYQ